MFNYKTPPSCRNYDGLATPSAGGEEEFVNSHKCEEFALNCHALLYITPI